MMRGGDDMSEPLNALSTILLATLVLVLYLTKTIDVFEFWVLVMLFKISFQLDERR